MSKFSRKRKAASAAAIAATEDVYDSHPFPNLDTELKSLQLKTNQISNQDSEQVLLANAPPKPYVRQKEEVLNDFLCCLALAPKQKWANLLKTSIILLPNGETARVPHIISMCSGPKTAQKIAIS